MIHKKISLKVMNIFCLLFSSLFCGCKNQLFSVTWKNYDGTILEIDRNLSKGTIPSYDGMIPKRESDIMHSYDFSGWSPKISAVKSDITYTAQFIEKTNCYDIYWANYDGTILKTDKISYGALPQYNGTLPTKPCTDPEFQFDFIGWSPAVVPVVGNALYTAQYEKVPKKYTVTWKNYDDTILEIDKNVAKGSIPSYDGLTPKKQSGEYLEYVFSGWSPEIKAVASDATYTAQFSSITKGKCVYELNDDGNSYMVVGYIDSSDQNYHILDTYKKKPVTTIAQDAFRNAKINEIYIPNTITTIGKYAFLNSTINKNVTIPNSVTEINDAAFADCKTSTIKFEDNSKLEKIKTSTFQNSKIESVIIPNGVTCIEDNAFLECSSLKKVVLPNSISSIGKSAFRKCSMLNSINLPEGICSIPDNCFSGCESLSTISIPNTIATIGAYSFFNCPLSTITIPENVVSINDHAFGGSYSLSSINFEKSTNQLRLGQYAFSGSFDDLYISSNITYISSTSFSIRSLKKISVDSNNNYYDSRNDCNAIISKKNNMLILGCSGTVIPDSVTSIGYYSFAYSDVVSLSVPNNVLAIGGYAFNSSKLTFLDLTAVDHLIEEGGCMFDNSNICNGGIKVKSELLDTYKNAWSAYSNYIYC